MDEQTALSKMVSPNMRRKCWRGGIIQIMITRSCDLACCHCTSGSNLGGKAMMMTPEQFSLACDSLANYWGVRAIFGGNPAMHPKFDQIMAIYREKVPFANSGIWCNHPLGKGHLMRGAANPATSNLNVHKSREAYDAFCAEWPESRPYLKGLDPDWPEAKAITDTHQRSIRVGDARHSPVYVAMEDLGYTEAEMWDRVAVCTCNQEWSSMVSVHRGKLRAWVCEIMGHQSMLHEHNPDWRGTGKPMPDTGIDVEECLKNGTEWWNHGMDYYAHQVREHCFACGVPLNGFGQLAVGGNAEQYTKTHEFIMKPKRRDRAVELVTSRDQIQEGGVPKMTNYIQNSSLPIIGQ